MKLKYWTAPLLAASLISGFGCQEAAEVYPAVYMTDAQSNPDKTMTVEEAPAHTTFTVSSSEVAKQDVHVTFEVAPQMIDEFNRKYGKNYQVPEASCYTLSALETVIETGFNSSAPIEFTVTDISGFAEGTTYCVPVNIVSVTGGMRILEPSRTLYIVLKTPVISKAIYLGSGNIYKVRGFQGQSSLESLPQATLEARVYMKSFASSDPYISSIMGIEGVCGVRFGDVKIDPNVLQICHGDYQPAATDKPFDTEKWYHVAAVWTGSSWDIYINGIYATGVPTQGETMNLASDNSGGFYLGASYGGGRPLNGYLAEVRVWTRALSQSEIANNMNYVDPTTAGLLAYWRMNAWEPNGSGGNIVRDETGHGYDAVGGSSAPEMIDTKWN